MTASHLQPTGSNPRGTTLVQGFLIESRPVSTYPVIDHIDRKTTPVVDNDQQTAAALKTKDQISGALLQTLARLRVRGRVGRPADLRSLPPQSPEIDRSDSSPRVRHARSVTPESALSVHAAMAAARIGHYSRRRRQGTSEERFPAGVAGRRRGRHACELGGSKDPPLQDRGPKTGD